MPDSPISHLSCSPAGPVRVTPHGTSVITGRNQSAWRKPATPGGVKLGNTVLTCDQSNFNQVTA